MTNTTSLSVLSSPLPPWPCTWQLLKGWKIKPKGEIGELVVYLDIHIIKFDHRLENVNINGEESHTSQRQPGLSSCGQIPSDRHFYSFYFVFSKTYIRNSVHVIMGEK